MRRTGKDSAGFTLVEILVVIGIMVAIAAIAVPLFSRGRELSRRSDAVNAVKAALAAARDSAIQRRTIVAVEFVSDTIPGTPNTGDPMRGDVMILVEKSFSNPNIRPELTADPTLRRLGPPIPLPDFIKFDGNRLLPNGTLYTSPEWTLANGWNGDANDTYDTLTFIPGAFPPYPDIAYMPDGTLADPEGTTDIALIDVSTPAREVLRVLPATGLIVEAAHLQDPLLPEGPTNPRVKGWN